MDRPNLHDNLFARGSPTPPTTQQPLSAKTSSSPNHHIDALFHNMSAPSSGQQMSTTASGTIYTNPAVATSNPSLNDPALSASTSAPVSSTADRQSALLSLLGSVPTSGGSVRGPSGGVPPTQSQPQPQQVPTPPGSSQRSGNSPNNANETQGKHLLEQLMSG